MSVAATLAYAAVFVAGPLLYLLLQKLTAVNFVLGALVVAVVACMAAALLLRAPAPLFALVSLWLSWVLAISLFVLALRRRALSPRLRRISHVAGLLGTTLPWFGFATARMVTL